jgi:DNA-binding LytR/AlgR family response regulator
MKAERIVEAESLDDLIAFSSAKETYTPVLITNSLTIFKDIPDSFISQLVAATTNPQLFPSLINNQIYPKSAYLISEDMLPTISAKPTLTIRSRKRVLEIDPQTIYSFQTVPNSHLIKALTTTNSFEFYGSLNQIESDNSELVIRIHEGFLINPTQVKDINKTAAQITLKNGSVIPFSRRYSKAMLKILN